MISLIKYPKYLYKNLFRYFKRKPKKLKFQPEREILKNARTFALLCMYNGESYYGSQINNGYKTVEGEVLKSLFQFNLISEKALAYPQLCYFGRTSRTDRMVSSVGQVFTVHFTEPEDIDVLFHQLKNSLPKDIILLDIFKLTKSFRVKFCNSRFYEYVIPTYTFEKTPLCSTEKLNYRISNDCFVKLNHILKLFIGTHRFHNYTSGLDIFSQSGYRLIINIDCSSPFLMNDIEFVTIQIHGQSFIIHQIRKMMAVTIALMRELIIYSIFQKTFSLQQVFLPKAPGKALLLDQVIYDSYNKRFTLHDDKLRPIVFSNYNAERLEFKANVIYKSILKSVIEDRMIDEWLLQLERHEYFRESCSIEILNTEDELFHGIYM